jgi:hypothetical protein
METKPPAPADLGLTFALSHLEDSPLEFLLVTLDRDKENDNEASIGIDMRVSDREVLQLMVNKMLQAIEALDEKPVGMKKK